MQLGFRIGLVVLKAPLSISHVARHIEIVLNGEDMHLALSDGSIGGDSRGEIATDGRR